MTECITEIAIIGGSGFCTFPEMVEKEKISIGTKFGKPSEQITIGNFCQETIAFLPRHGFQHQLAPHAIPYRANIAALKEIGVKYIFAFCVAGSLKKRIKPGEFVVPDQFVNLTWGRDVSFEPDQPFIHLPMAEPYSKTLREIAYQAGREIKLKIHQNGTVVVIQGPRFNTLAESIWFSKLGWDIVNMTQYPECYFVKEQGLEYTGIAAITDYDIGLQDLGLSMAKDKLTETSQIFTGNIQRSKDLIAQILKDWQTNRINLNGQNPHTAKLYGQI